MKILFSLIFAGLMLMALEYMGVWTSTISHQFWSLSSTLKGIAGGAVISLACFWLLSKGMISRVLLTILAILATGVSCFITWWGKTEFALSYAENDFAGQMWFFGFITLNIFLFVSVFLILQRRQQKK